jgi:hypothetical protein
MKPSILRSHLPLVRCLVAVAACTAAVAACGTATSGGSAAGGSPSPAAPKVSLNITVSGAPGSTAKHWTLTCEPAGGTHPDPAAACRQLLGVKGPFAPEPKGMECPMILASTKEVTIQGTYLGQPVNTVLRDGGCTLSRWTELGQLVN